MKNFGRKTLGLVLAISMVCAILPVAVMATATTTAWIEGESDLLEGSYTADGTRDYDGYSNGKAQYVYTKTAPGDDGYYFDHKVELQAGTYDIYFCGADDEYDDTMSDAKAYVDAVEKSYVNLESEEYDGDDQKALYFGWMKVSGVELTEGEHTIRWAYEEKGSSNRYFGGLDCIVILPGGSTFTPTVDDIAQTKQDYDALVPSSGDSGSGGSGDSGSGDSGSSNPTPAWIEGEDYTRSNYTTTKSGDGCDIALSGNNMLKLGSTNTKGYSEYDVDLGAGSYDIYFRGGDNFNGGTWTSNVTPSVDGTTMAYTQVEYEGWPNWNGSASNYDQGWVKVSDVALTEGTHTIRWEYLDSRVSSPTYYAGGLDCIAILPSGAPFTPVNKNIANTKLDYYMSVLLLGKNLANVTENLTLPTALADETTVTWSSNNTNVLANDGTVKRPETSNATVTLTATAGGYSKDFEVTVIAESGGSGSGYAKIAWIEGENPTSGGFTSKQSRNEFSAGKAYQLATQTAPSNVSNGYYADYSVNLESGAYDIYFRAVDDAFALNSNKTAAYMSDAHLYVDGAEKAYTNILDEGWGKDFSSSVPNYAHGWLKISGVELTEDTHTLRLAYLDTATGNTAWYFGGLDCIAVLPSGAPFTPVEKNITNTKLDYFMSLLLLDEDLTKVTENLTLPSELANGTAVTWSSSKTNVLANDGTVTRPLTSNANVTLTATAGGYSKDFAVKVLGLSGSGGSGYASNAWIEGEDDLLSGSYTGNGTRNFDCYSGGKAQMVNTNSTPGVNGYYFDHEVSLSAGSYDIYFHASDDEFSSDWMSNATAYVDGEEKEYSSLSSEGWDAQGGFAYGWLKVTGVELTEDAHTIRWAYKEPRKSSPTQYIGVLDCIVIVPSGSPFKPSKSKLESTMADYNMCTLLGDYDLSNITDNILLPTALPGGRAVSWSSSDKDVIANDGTVVRPVGGDVKVTLTATAAATDTEDERKMDFVATVKCVQVTLPPIGGTLTSGGTVTASATVTSNGNTSGKANLILAIYRPDKMLGGKVVRGEMIKGAVSIDEKAIVSATTTFDCSVTIDSGLTGDLSARAFVWGEGMQPLSDEITLNN